VASFKVCIKHYADGRTSNFLFDQPEGKEIFFEGPFAPSWELQMDAYVKKTPLEGRHILLLAGGTGIAPMYSIAYHELEKQTTSVTLVSSVQTPDDLLLAGEMSRMQIRYSSPLPGQRHTLRVALAFSRVPKNVPTPQTAVKSPILVRCGSHIDVSFLKALKLPPTQAAVICGPPAFNSAMAKAVLQAGICPIECTHTL
jgi:NAD(P)H-flavin reductase